jgi:ectoine hydroxylase-related dioxygenase (phytanoyl-CoA dioxygenase family)
MELRMATEREATQILSAHEREKYDRDGYLVVESSCSEAVLDGIVADLEDKYRRDHGWEDGVGYLTTRIREGWRISANVKALALDPKVFAILRELYGREPLPFQTINFCVGTQQKTHSDTIHFNSMPSGYMCGAWVALEDMDMDNGPLIYYPGSHKLHEVSMQDVGVEAHASEYPHYESFIADLIEREDLQPEYGTIRKGQVLIWSANLLHGGAPQRDESRTRHSQVTHYFFEGCKYYTPMSSKPEDVQWREPEWIS